MIEFCGGDYTGVVPPDPIPNSEVKYTKADGSVMNARVGSRHQRTQLKKEPTFLGVGFWFLVFMFLALQEARVEQCSS